MMNIEHVSWHSICEARSNIEWKRVQWLLTMDLEPLNIERSDKGQRQKAQRQKKGLPCVAAGEEGRKNNVTYPVI